MKSINSLLQNKIPLGRAFNILLVSNNIRKVAQIEYFKKINYLKKFFEKNNIHYIDNKKEKIIIIYNNTIKINNTKLSSDIYDTEYVGKILNFVCASKNYCKLYKRKINPPFQVRFMVKYKKKTDNFMSQMCIDNKTLSKSHKQITNFQKELEKQKLDFYVYMEVDPQPIYWNKKRPIYYKK